MKPANLYQQALLDIPNDVKREVSLSFSVADRIYDLMKSKGMTQRELAKKMGKSEPEVSSWLTGRHNFTLRTIAKIAAILEEDILIVP